MLRLRVLEEIREKQALAYSPGVGAQSSDVYPDYGFMLVQGEIARDNLAAFNTAVDGIAATLRDAPPEADELNRARLPAIERLRLSQATNEYWLGQLADVAEREAIAAVGDGDGFSVQLSEARIAFELAQRALVLLAHPGECAIAFDLFEPKIRIGAGHGGGSLGWSGCARRQDDGR